MVQKEDEPRRRGRPRSYDPVKALDQARAAFWDVGFAATSLDDLSVATGLNRPSLYGAFGDKRAIYLASLKRSRAETTAALNATLGSGATLREALERVYALSIPIYLAGKAGPRGCFMIGTAVTESVGDAEVREILAGALAEIDAAFATRFARARAEGDLPPGVAPAALAPVAAAVLQTLGIRARTGADADALSAVAAAGVTLICGLAHRGRPATQS